MRTAAADELTRCARTRAKRAELSVCGAGGDGSAGGDAGGVSGEAPLCADAERGMGMSTMRTWMLLCRG